MLRRIDDDVFNDDMIISITQNKTKDMVYIFLLGKNIVHVNRRTLDEVFAFLQTSEAVMK